jgi:ketol-acid reductoisomerase
VAVFLAEEDVDRSAIADRLIAVVGYGSQGHAHALNLADSGADVRVGLRRDSVSWAKASDAGLRVLEVDEAAAEADVVMILLPDTVAADVYSRQIAPQLRPGDALGFAHGFNIRFGQITPPEGIDVLMVAPSGPGHLLRRLFLEGSGLAALIAVAQDATGGARALALAYADAIGSTRAAVIESTFAEETETDLFGEQVVLCGGVVELAKSGFATLVEAGYQPEVAYFECVHQIKLIVDLIYEQGIAGMRFSISDTAEYGGLTRGPRVVADGARHEMRRILQEIRDGSFASEWIDENRRGRPHLAELREAEATTEVERVGDELRAMMPFLAAGRERFEESSGG